jgi:hypothetical protein
MAISRNDDGTFTLSPRKPGLEAAAFGSGFAPDLNADGSFGGVEGGVEITSGGLLTYAIYSAVMTALETTPAVRSGAMTRGEQRQAILDQTWSVTRNAVPTVVIIAALLAVAPWMGPAMGVVGFVGGAVMTTRLVRAALDAMPQEQRDNIKAKAKEVGVEVPGISDIDEPLPTMS